jgi:hypothetical protein
MKYNSLHFKPYSMDTPEEPDQFAVDIEMYDVGINNQEFKEETYYLPSGEVFMYTLKWNDPIKGVLTLVGELVEGVWKYFYTKPQYELLDKGVKTYVTETYSYESDIFLDPTELVALMAAPEQVSTKVSTRRVPVGDNRIETHISINIIMDQLEDNYELIFRDHSYILKQDGIVVAAQNLMQQMVLRSTGPHDSEIPTVFRNGEVFELMTDDYLLILVPVEQFYLGKLTGPTTYQTEG